MSTTEIQELEERLAWLKKQESEKNKLTAEEKKEMELNELKLIWNEDKIRKIIRNGYFEVEYVENDYYILGARREFIFGDYGWEKAIYEVKYGCAYDEDSEDFEEYDISQLEIDFIMKAAIKIINNQIKNI